MFKQKMMVILRKLPKVIAILLSIALVIYLGFQIFLSIYFKPHDVRLTNITDTSFTVSWITNYPKKGIVYYKEKDSILPWFFSWIGTKKAYDDRDVALAEHECVEKFNKEAKVSEDFVVDTSKYGCNEVEVKKFGTYYVHHVTLTNLEENTEYYFRVGDGLFSRKMDLHKNATFLSLDKEANEPAPIFGSIVNDKGEYVNDSVVYIKFINGYLEKESMYYSSVTSNDGSWYLDSNNIRTIEGEPIIVENGQDMIKVYAQYENYALSGANDWLYGVGDFAYPNIVVSDSWEKDLSQNTIEDRNNYIGFVKGVSAALVNVKSNNRLDQYSDGGTKYGASSETTKDKQSTAERIAASFEQEQAARNAAEYYEKVGNEEEADIARAAAERAKEQRSPEKLQQNREEALKASKEKTNNVTKPKSTPPPCDLAHISNCTDAEILAHVNEWGPKNIYDKLLASGKLDGEIFRLLYPPADGNDYTLEEVNRLFTNYNIIKGAKWDWSNFYKMLGEMGSQWRQGFFIDGLAEANPVVENMNDDRYFDPSAKVVEIDGVYYISALGPDYASPINVPFYPITANSEYMMGLCGGLDEKSLANCGSRVRIERIEDRLGIATYLSQWTTGYENLHNWYNKERGSAMPTGVYTNGGLTLTYDFTNKYLTATGEGTVKLDEQLLKILQTDSLGKVGDVVSYDDVAKAIASVNNAFYKEGTTMVGYQNAINEQGRLGDNYYLQYDGAGKPFTLKENIRFAPDMNRSELLNNNFNNFLQDTIGEEFKKFENGYNKSNNQYYDELSVIDKLKYDRMYNQVIDQANETIRERTSSCQYSSDPVGCYSAPVIDENLKDQLIGVISNGAKVKGVTDTTTSPSSDSKVLGAEDSSNTLGSGYVTYLPEYGFFDMEIAGLKETNKVEGQTLHIYYVETNGIEGFQMPADPDNPKETEDLMLQSNSLNISYKKSAEVMTLNLKKGINLVSFNYIPKIEDNEYAKASTFVEWLSNQGTKVEHMSYFSGGRWKGIGYVGGKTTGDDFNITPGKGYLVYTEADATVSIPGYRITSSVPVPLSAGWNLVGIHGYSQMYTARSFIDSINSVEGLTANNVSWWPTSKGKYEGLQVVDGKQYGFDFSLSSSNGYFVRISKFLPKDSKCKSLLWHAGGSHSGACGGSK